MNKILIFTIVVILLVFITAAIYMLNTDLEKFIIDNINIEFVSREYFTKICKESPYFSRMNQYDLFARRINSADEDYLSVYLSSIEHFTEKQKEQLRELCKEANKLASKYQYFNNIPWKFVKVGSHIENSYPHTLGDVIVLTDQFLSQSNIVCILLHEKMHVFQRLYPEKMDALIRKWNMYKVKYIHPLERNNPDLNEYSYGQKPYIIQKQLYTSDQPISLMDSKVFDIDIRTHEIQPSEIKFDGIHQVEHPYEISACMFANILCRKNNKKSQHEKLFIEWANEYLTY